MADRETPVLEVTCRELVELVTDYREGALSDHELTLVEEHLVVCDGCATYFAQMEAIVNALAALAAEPVSRSAHEQRLQVFRETRRLG